MRGLRAVYRSVLQGALAHRALTITAAAVLFIGALVLALLVGLLQAGLVLIYIVMLARIYVQLAGARSAEATVPTSGS